MSHSDIIIIVVTLAISSTLGVYAIIRKINHYTRPPINTLNRRGDLELIDYIEPTQPGHAYYPIDLSNPQYINYDRVHSYYSGNPPSYHTNERFFINSCLENENIINSDFIIFIFMFMFFTIIFLKMNSLYVMSLLIPFSFFEIDFRDSFEWKFNSYRDKPKISYMKLQTLTEDIIKLLNSLKDDENYSMGLSFIRSYKEWKKDKRKIHPLLIDDAIIINKESDPIIISQFIMKNLDKKGYFITNWLFKYSSINLMDPIILAVTVAIKVKI